MSEPSRSTLEVRSLRVLAQVPDFLFPEMKPPAFQFYADDFLGGTLTMTLEERGLYITLLCLQWSKGFVTEDDLSALAQLWHSHHAAMCAASSKMMIAGACETKDLRRCGVNRTNFAQVVQPQARRVRLRDGTAIAQPMAQLWHSLWQKIALHLRLLTPYMTLGNPNGRLLPPQRQIRNGWKNSERIRLMRDYQCQRSSPRCALGVRPTANSRRAAASLTGSTVRKDQWPPMPPTSPLLCP